MSQPTPVDLDAVEAASRQLLDDRMNSVRTLAKARQEVHDQAAVLGDVEAADKDAYDAAVKAGWTAPELRKVGLAPLAKNGTAPRSTPRSTPRAAGRGSRRRPSSSPSPNSTPESGAADPAESGAEPPAPSGSGGSEAQS